MPLRILKPPYARVSVFWIDSESTDKWVSPLDAYDPFSLLETRGVLIRCDREAVVVAQTRAVHAGNEFRADPLEEVGCIWRIPRTLVKRIHYDDRKPRRRVMKRRKTR